jgi:hypothetical protein
MSAEAAVSFRGKKKVYILKHTYRDSKDFEASFDIRAGGW